jgi:hypothetical protein
MAQICAKDEGGRKKRGSCHYAASSSVFFMISWIKKKYNN